MWEQMALRSAFAAGQPVVSVTRGPLSPQLRNSLSAHGFGRRGVPRRSDRSLVAEVLLARLLWQCYGVPPQRMVFHAMPGSRPAVFVPTGSGWAAPGISLSHCGDAVAAAVSQTGSIGVDLEAVGPLPWRVLERVFAREDQEALLGLPQADREPAFAQLWTVAEACAKATGRGLRLLLAGFDPLGLEDRGRWRSFRWASRFLDPSICCSLAVDRSGVPAESLAAVAEVPLASMLDPP